MQNRNEKIMTWQDAYYDGKLDEEYQDFCEDTQEIVDKWFQNEFIKTKKIRKKYKRDIYDL
jgi:hypothetical protein